MTDTTSEASAPPSPWRSVLRWTERLVWIGLLLFVGQRLLPQLGALTGIAVGEGSTPVWSVETLAGDTLGSAELAGQVVIVNFWATWCPPCRLEMPSLQKLQEEKGSEGITVVGVSVDTGGEQAIRTFLEERGITFPIARVDSEVRRAFGGVKGLPTTFVLDREGRIRHRVVGYFAPPALHLAVGRLLDEGGPD